MGIIEAILQKMQEYNARVASCNLVQTGGNTHMARATHHTFTRPKVLMLLVWGFSFLFAHQRFCKLNEFNSYMLFLLKTRSRGKSQTL